MQEKNVERMLREKVESQIPGAKCLKFVSPGFTGVPDRIIFLPGGVSVLVELKKPGEQPRQRQLFVQSRFRKLGFHVYGCVDCPEKVEAVVAACMKLASAAKAQKKKAGTATQDNGHAEQGSGEEVRRE